MNCTHENPPGISQLQQIEPGQYKCRICGAVTSRAPMLTAALAEIDKLNRALAETLEARDFNARSAVELSAENARLRSDLRRAEDTLREIAESYTAERMAKLARGYAQGGKL